LPGATYAIPRSAAAAPRAETARRSDAGPLPPPAAQDRLTRLDRTLNAGPGVRQLKAMNDVIQLAKVTHPLTGQRIDLEKAGIGELRALLADLRDLASYQNPRTKEIDKVEEEIAARGEVVGSTSPSSASSTTTTTTTTSEPGLLDWFGAGITSVADGAKRFKEHGLDALGTDSAPLKPKSEKDKAAAGKEMIVSAGVAGAKMVAAKLTSGASTIALSLGSAAVHLQRKSDFDAITKRAKDARSSCHIQAEVEAFNALIVATEKASAAYTKMSVGSAAGSYVPGSSMAGDMAAEDQLKQARQELKRLSRVESENENVVLAARMASDAFDIFDWVYGAEYQPIPDASGKDEDWGSYGTSKS
jgi:hypothetical protein